MIVTSIKFKVHAGVVNMKSTVGRSMSKLRALKTVVPIGTKLDILTTSSIEKE